MKPSRPLLFALSALFLAPFSFGAVETWTDLDNRTVEAEFVSVKGTYVTFRKADGSRYLFPFDKLSAADQQRVLERSGAAPAAGTVAAASPSVADAAPAPAPAGKFTTEIAGKLVAFKNGGLSPVAPDAVQGTRFYAIYYSAQWCPPCRGFTPKLVEAYKALKASHPEFELIFVSSDENTDAMKTYMRDYKMPWPALRHEFAKALPAVTRYAGRGIPNLVFITADGEVLSRSYVGGQYVGPKKVLADITKKLAEKS